MRASLRRAYNLHFLGVYTASANLRRPEARKEPQNQLHDGWTSAVLILLKIAPQTLKTEIIAAIRIQEAGPVDLRYKSSPPPQQLDLPQMRLDRVNHLLCDSLKASFCVVHVIRLPEHRRRKGTRQCI